MKYQQIWDKTLSPNEEVKYEFSIGDKYRMFWIIAWCIIGAIFALGSITMAVIIIVVGVFYAGFYLKQSNAYAFTTKRVVVHKGWLSTSMISIDYDKITDVTVTEQIVDKLFTGSGDLHINTAGSLGNEVVLKNITHPYEVKKKLDSLRVK